MKTYILVCVYPAVWEFWQVVYCLMYISVTSLGLSQWCNQGFQSSGIWCCVAGLVVPDMAKDHSAFVFRVHEEWILKMKAVRSFETPGTIHSDIESHPRRSDSYLFVAWHGIIESKMKVWVWVVLWSQLGDTLLVWTKRKQRKSQWSYIQGFKRL